MASAMQNALKRKRELERELAEIDTFIRLHERFAGTERARPLSTDSPAAEWGGEESSVVPDAVEPPPVRHRSRPADFARLAEQAIRDAGRPLMRAEIVAAIEAGDVTVPSQDKPRYIGTILWRNRKRFVNLPGEGYTLPEMLPAEAVQKAFAIGEIAEVVLDKDPEDTD